MPRPTVRWIAVVVLVAAAAAAQAGPEEDFQTLVDIHARLREKVSASPQRQASDVLVRIDNGLGKGAMELLLRRRNGSWLLRDVTPLPDALDLGAFDPGQLTWQDGRITGPVKVNLSGDDADENGQEQDSAGLQVFQVDLQVKPGDRELVITLQRFTGRDDWQLAYRRQGEKWVYQSTPRRPRSLQEYTWQAEPITVEADGRFSGTIGLEYTGDMERIIEGTRANPPRVSFAGRLIAGQAESAWQRTGAGGKGLLGTGQDTMVARTITGRIEGSYVAQGAKGQWLGEVSGLVQSVPADALAEVDFLTSAPAPESPQGRAVVAVRLYREIRAMARALADPRLVLADAVTQTVAPEPVLGPQAQAQLVALLSALVGQARSVLPGNRPQPAEGPGQVQDPRFGPYYGLAQLPVEGNAMDKAAGPWMALGGWQVLGPFALPASTARVVAPEILPVDGVNWQRERFFTEADGQAAVRRDRARWLDARQDRAIVYVPETRDASAGSMRELVWYARSTLQSPAARKTWLAMRLSGQAAVWVNRRLVYLSGHQLDTLNPVCFQADLQAGANEVLVRMASSPASNRRYGQVDWMDGYDFRLLGRAEMTFFELYASADPAAAPRADRQVQPVSNGHGPRVYPQAQPPVAWDLEKPVNVEWRIDLPPGTATPVVHDGRMYLTAEPNVVLCIDARTGKQIWQQAVGKVVTESPAEVGMYQASARPAVDDRGIFVVFGNGATSRLSLDGQVVWTEQQAGWKQPNMGSPLLLGDRLITQVHLSDQPEDTFALVARAAETGKLLWTAKGSAIEPISQHDRAAGLGNGLASMELAAGDNKRAVIITGDGAVVDAESGRLLHRKIFDLLATRAEPYVVGDTVFTAAISGQQAVRLWLDESGRLAARSLWRSGPQWGRGQTKTVTDWGQQHWMKGPVVSGGRMYVVRIDSAHVPQHYVCPWTQVEVFDAATGERISRTRALLRDATDPTIAPVIAGGYLFAGDGGSPIPGFGGTVEFGQMAVLDLRAGQQDSDFRMRTPVHSGLWGPALRVSVNRIPQTRCAPVFLGDRMYLRSFGSLVCIRAADPDGQRFEDQQIATAFTADLVGRKPEHPEAIQIRSGQPLDPADPASVSPVRPDGNGRGWVVLGPLDASIPAERISAALELAEMPQPGSEVRIDGKAYRWQAVGTEAYLPGGQVNVVAAMGGRRDGQAVLACQLESRRGQQLLYKPEPAVKDTWIAGQEVRPDDRIDFGLGRYPMFVRTYVKNLPDFIESPKLTLGLTRAPAIYDTQELWTRRIRMLQEKLRWVAQSLPGSSQARSARVQLAAAGLDAPAPAGPEPRTSGRKQAGPVVSGDPAPPSRRQGEASGADSPGMTVYLAAGAAGAVVIVLLLVVMAKRRNRMLD